MCKETGKFCLDFGLFSVIFGNFSWLLPDYYFVSVLWFDIFRLKEYALDPFVL